MKNHILFTALIILLTLLGFSSCTKVTEATGGLLGVGQCEVKASVAGAVSTTYTSNNLTSTAAKSGLMLNFNSTTISPVRMFTILLPVKIATGSYNLKNNDALGGISFAYVHDNGGTGFAASSNNDDDFIFVVTKSTATEIEGTFSGNMHNDDAGTSVKITNGSFRAKF